MKRALSIEKDSEEKNNYRAKRKKVTQSKME